MLTSHLIKKIINYLDISLYVKFVIFCIKQERIEISMLVNQRQTQVFIKMELIIVTILGQHGAYPEGTKENIDLV